MGGFTREIQASMGALEAIPATPSEARGTIHGAPLEHLKQFEVIPEAIIGIIPVVHLQPLSQFEATFLPFVVIFGTIHGAPVEHLKHFEATISVIHEASMTQVRVICDCSWATHWALLELYIASFSSIERVLYGRWVPYDLF